MNVNPRVIKWGQRWNCPNVPLSQSQTAESRGVFLCCNHSIHADSHLRTHIRAHKLFLTHVAHSQTSISSGMNRFSSFCLCLAAEISSKDSERMDGKPCLQLKGLELCAGIFLWISVEWWNLDPWWLTDCTKTVVISGFGALDTQSKTFYSWKSMCHFQTNKDVAVWHHRRFMGDTV